MSKRQSRRYQRPGSARLDTALARLLGSTRRTRRKLDLLGVAKELAVAEKSLGGRRAVAARLAISTEMLRQFASVEKLSPSVKEMIKDGRIASVDVAYRLSMLPCDEQEPVAAGYVRADLTGRDIRDIVSYRRRHPSVPIDRAIKRVRASRDVVQYVMRFSARGLDETDLRGRFEKLLGRGNVVSAVRRGPTAVLTITATGQRRLREEAGKRSLTKHRFVRELIGEATA